jgi:hypothetical protein
MIRVCVAMEGAEDSSARLYVKAENIRRALEVAEEHNPGCAVNVVFPLDPDTFFAQDAQEGVEAESTEMAA